MNRILVVLAFLFWPASSWASGYQYSSCYQPGYTYYGAGYYGGTYYQAGYYKPTYVAEQVYYPRYVAVVPLVSLPSYGSYYVAPPAGAPAEEPAKKAMAAAPDRSKEILDAVNRLGSGMEQVKAEVKTVTFRMDDLDRRLRALEGGATPPPGPGGPTDPFNPGKAPGRPPEKAPPPRPAPPAPAPGAAAHESVPQMFHADCARCHDARAAAKDGGGLVMFVTEFDEKGNAVSAEFAPTKGGSHTPATLKKVRTRLATKDAKKQMPPPDEHGKSLLADDRRQAMLRWIDEEVGKAGK